MVEIPPCEALHLRDTKKPFIKKWNESNGPRPSMAERWDNRWVLESLASGKDVGRHNTLTCRARTEPRVPFSERTH